jgi:hypothetical protein
MVYTDTEPKRLIRRLIKRKLEERRPVDRRPTGGVASMKPKVPTDFTRRLLTTAAAVIGLAPVAFVQASGAQAADPQTFFVLNNPNDPMFNQLLGINNGHVIVGYFGDGMAIANNGYVLVPKNHYSVENFTNLPNGDTASQTQAIGINENSALGGATPFPDIVGFYTDMATGFTHGFLDSTGVQSTIDDPAGLPPQVTTPVQNLLGINNALAAAGFWTDNAGHEQGFVVEINTQTTPVSTRFTELTPAKVSADLGVGAVATQTSNITNNNLVCGFWTNAKGINHGFEVFFNTATHSFNMVQRLTANPAQIPNVKSLSPFGCNDNGAVVGSFIANDGTVHGFVFDGTDWHKYDAAGSSQTAAFGVMGTFINGINNAGNIVGFFSDGENVNGFVDFAPVP